MRLPEHRPKTLSRPSTYFRWGFALYLCFRAVGTLAEDSVSAKPSDQLPTQKPAEPAKKGETVELDKMVVTQTQNSAEATFNDRAGTETFSEVVAGAALKNPNAQSGSDLLKNVSGVDVRKNGDGTSKVSVRGLDQRLLRITVDGQRQGGSANPLDSIPPEIVQSLEVIKSFTPDMEADAVGGVINVNTGGTVTKQPYEKGRQQLTYNSLEPRVGSRNSLSVARPFRLLAAEPNASVLLTASYDDQYKLRERVSALREWPAQISPGPAPFTGVAFPALTLPVIESTREHRKRTGLLLNADARLGPTALFWHANFNRDRAQRDRRLNDTDPASGLPVALTPTSGLFSGVEESRRNQLQVTQRDAANFSLGGKHQSGRTEMDVTLAYALTHENEPRTAEAMFRSNHLYRAGYDFSRDAFAPVFSATDETNPADTSSISNPAEYHFNYLGVTRGDSRDEEASAKFNLKIHLGDAATSENYLKFGGKVQQRKRETDTDRSVYGAGLQALAMTGLVGAPTVAMKTLAYQFGPVPDAGAVARLAATTPAEFTVDPIQTLVNSRSGDYAATEEVWALYGMGKLKREQWTLLGGVRLEGTRVIGSANQLVLDSTGAVAGFRPARAVNEYLEVLPGLHLRYEPAAGLLWRGSVTRSLSRPTYSDLVPFQTFSFLDHRSRVGTPALKPYEATNVDLSVDKFHEAYGLFSLALFFKKISHFIADAQNLVDEGVLGQFIQFSRVNGEAAEAMGAEVTWQSLNWDLPHGLGRASTTVNYSLTHGVAHYPTRPGESFPLPDQVTYQGGVTIHWDVAKLSVEGAARYRSQWWEDLIAPGFDNYLQGYWDAELSATYKLGKDTRLTAGVANLINAPMRHYAGTTSHFNDYQRNGIDFTVGLLWKL